MQTYVAGDGNMGAVVSDGLADLAKRLSERAAGGVLHALTRPLQEVVDLETRTAPVKTGRYKRSIHLVRTISSTGVGVAVGAVAYSRYIWCPQKMGPVPPGVGLLSGDVSDVGYVRYLMNSSNPGPSKAKPGTRWQAFLRKPALAVIDGLLAGPLGKAIVESANGR